jgi:hypothetical protein
MPEPTPSITPSSSTSCQKAVISRTRPSPAAMTASAVTITLRRPKRSINRAENGPISPNSAKRTASAVEIWSTLQPNSRLSGFNKAPGRPRAADDDKAVKKVIAAMIQP